MTNIYQDNAEYFQKIIHVSKQKLLDKYGPELVEDSRMREYTTLVFYNKRSKMARFEVAITHPKQDRFSREGGRDEVLRKLGNDKAFMLIDLTNVVTYVDNKKGTITWMDSDHERHLISHLLSDFTHEIVPIRLFGKK